MRLLKMIAIIDYGMGNIHSVQKALNLFGAKTMVTNRPQDIKLSDMVVLPGVGAFADAIAELKGQGLASAIGEHIRRGGAFLGICLGMQLLFDSSQEAEATAGLGLLRGSVKSLKGGNCLKVPHMGWNQLVLEEKECPLFKGVADNSYVYFCHSYYPDPMDKNIIAATCDYGNRFVSVLWQDNIFGVQFHPEKSQEAGLKILENFVNLC